MTRGSSPENQPKISDDNSNDRRESESSSDSRANGIDLLTLTGNDRVPTKNEPVELAAAGSIAELLPPKNPVPTKPPSPEKMAEDRAWLEFPGNIDDKGAKDPYEKPRELARRDNLGEPLFLEEDAELQSWRQFPGLDPGSSAVRLLMAQEIVVPNSLSNEEQLLLNSWEDFPNPDKRLDRARNLYCLNSKPGDHLKPEEKAELCAWKSFYNPDPQYDRPRELIQKVSQKDGTLTDEEKAELASWLDFPGADDYSATLRALAHKDYSDPENGLKPTEIAKLEAGKIFGNSDRRLNFARKLVEQHIASNYNVEGVKPITKAQFTQLKAWVVLRDPDKSFDEARELIRLEASGIKLFDEQSEIVETAKDRYSNPPEPHYKEPNKDFYKNYDQHKPDLPKRDSRRDVNWKILLE